MTTIPSKTSKTRLLPFHRLYYTFSGIKTSEVLNPTPPETTQSANIAFELRQAINFLKLDAFNEDTGRVDYARLKSSEAYTNYRQTTRKLHAFPLHSLGTLEEKLAFWINLYNVLIVDAVIHYGVNKTVREIRGFFARAAYIIDGMRFSADDIEHGILRANAGHVAIPGPQFGESDPRRAFIVPKTDPRLHFTLVCASQSCPPIGVYHADRIEHQLNVAAMNFINGGEVEVDLHTHTATLSKIFQWYSPDFGGSAINQGGLGKHTAVLKYIAPFIQDEEVRLRLSTMADQFKVKFKPYDWGLNLTSADIS